MNRSSSEQHPDANTLSNYADRLLTPDQRADIERHLATCARCRSILIDTMAFLTSPDEAQTHRPVVHFSLFRRRWFAAAVVGLAAAAGLVLAVRVGQPDVAGHNSAEWRQLIAAVGKEPARSVEGRLTGGFAYGPTPSMTRGGDRFVSPDLRIAAAAIEQRAGTQPTADTESALGVAFLIVGDLDRAVAALESAVNREPGNAKYQSDLSAAYQARALARSQVDDFDRALAAAERAVASDATLTEACFNRALALQHLSRDTQQDWARCLSAERDQAWRSGITRRSESGRR